MQEKFLIDTNALINLRAGEIQTLRSKGLSLFVSSYSCWEQICHLDEENKYRYIRGNLLKMQYCKILDDPFEDTSNNNLRKNWKSDAIFISALLASLEKAQTLEELYEIIIIDPNNNYREIDGIAKRAREIISLEKRKYLNVCDKIVNRLRETKIPNDSDFHHNMILSLVQGKVNQLNENGNPTKFSYEEILDRFYIYYGYIYYRCYFLYKNGGRANKNDFVDSAICKNITLSSPYSLITSDNRYIDAITQIRANCKVNNPHGVNLLFTLCDIDAFRQMIDKYNN